MKKLKTGQKIQIIATLNQLLLIGIPYKYGKELIKKELTIIGNHTNLVYKDRQYEITGGWWIKRKYFKTIK